MNINNPGWLRLIEIPKYIYSQSDITSEQKVKIKDTARYSMAQSPDQIPKECIKKCTIAVMAEYHVADWMLGYVNRGLEDLEDPYTYAYDVLCHPKYSGLRIEVKTHQAQSKWITVTSGYTGPYTGGKGINIGPFINFNVADLIIIFNVEELDNTTILSPWMIADKETMHPSSGAVIKSKFGGWILSGRVNPGVETAFKIISKTVYNTQ